MALSFEEGLVAYNRAFGEGLCNLLSYISIFIKSVCKLPLFGRGVL